MLTGPHQISPLLVSSKTIRLSWGLRPVFLRLPDLNADGNATHASCAQGDVEDGLREVLKALAKDYERKSVPMRYRNDACASFTSAMFKRMASARTRLLHTLKSRIIRVSFATGKGKGRAAIWPFRSNRCIGGKWGGILCGDISYTGVRKSKPRAHLRKQSWC